MKYNVKMSSKELQAVTVALASYATFLASRLEEDEVPEAFIDTAEDNYMITDKLLDKIAAKYPEVMLQMQLAYS